MTSDGTVNEGKGSEHINLQSAQGVIVGQGQQHNSWSLISLVLNPKVMFIGVTAVVLLVATVLYLEPWAASPDVRLVEYNVAGPSRLTGMTFEESSMGGGPLQRSDVGEQDFDVTPVDIILKNNGAASAVVVEAIATVVYANHLGDCAETGGPLQIEANYDILLPPDPPQVPFTVRKSLPFEVEPHKSERFTLTIGPNIQRIESWDARLYIAEIALKLDYSDELLQVGRAGWVTQSGDGYSNLNQGLGGNEECLKQNAAAVAEFGKTAAKRSEEADHLIRRWEQLVNSHGNVHKPTCNSQDYSRSRTIAGACGTYTQDLFLGSVAFDWNSAEGKELLIRITTKDGLLKYAIRCKVSEGKPPARQVRLLSPDTKITAVENCSDHSPSGVVLWAFADNALEASELLMSVYVFDAGRPVADLNLPPKTDPAGAVLVARST